MPWNVRAQALVKLLKAAVESRVDDQVQALCWHLSVRANKMESYFLVDIARGVRVRYVSGEYARALELLEQAA